jgi:hypothetical protein
LDELLARRGLLGRAGLDLRLDVEPDVADTVVADVGEFGVARERRRGVAALVRRHLAVMRDYGPAVLCDLHVELERRHAELDRLGERRQRALVRARSRATLPQPTVPGAGARLVNGRYAARSRSCAHVTQAAMSTWPSARATETR